MNSNFENFGNTNNGNDAVFSWDTPIVAEVHKEFTLLPKGEYPFTIVKVEKGRYEPSPGAKMPACPKATLTFKITHEGNDAELKYNLFYTEKMKWRVDDVFIGTGKAIEGQSYSPNPDALLGATGMCEVSQVPGFNDASKTFNEIKKIIRQPKQQGFGGF